MFVFVSLYIKFEIHQIKTSGMPTVIVHHEVKDFDGWKSAFDSGASAREAKGISHLHIGRHSTQPNHVYMVFDVADASVLHDHLGHDNTKNLQEEGGGIVGENHVIVME
jgi:hypothetical protein